MITRRYQVFVSSTYTDLKHERIRVLLALAEGNYIPAGMEYFPAIDEEQFSFIKREIDLSDYYVTIAAGRYGTLALDGLSYTEKEYDYALEKGTPVIALIRADIELLPEDKRESEPEGIQALKKFHTKLSFGRVVRYWRDETELCTRLQASLAAQIARFPRPGWVKGSDIDIDQFSNEISSLTREKLALERSLDEMRGRHIEDHIRQELTQDARIRYKAAGSEEFEEASLRLRTIADQIVPRLQEAVFVTDVEKWLVDIVSRSLDRAVAGVESDDAWAIWRTLSNLGLVNLQLHWNKQTMMLNTALGVRVIGRELVEMYKRENAKANRKREQETVMARGFVQWWHKLFDTQNRKR